MRTYQLLTYHLRTPEATKDYAMVLVDHIESLRHYGIETHGIFTSGNHDPLYLFGCHLEWRHRRNLGAYHALVAALGDCDRGSVRIAEIQAPCNRCQETSVQGRSKSRASQWGRTLRRSRSDLSRCPSSTGSKAVPR
jgi:hypothetical protein